MTRGSPKLQPSLESIEWLAILRTDGDSMAVITRGDLLNPSSWGAQSAVSLVRTLTPSTPKPARLNDSN